MSNPTRPAAGSAQVEQRLRSLRGAKKRRLEEWGYPFAHLADLAARSDADADRVDALLAIVGNRAGYTHNDADVSAAEKVAKIVGARMTPHAYLVSKHKAAPWPVVYGRFSSPPGVKPISWLGIVAVFGFVFGVIVLIAVIAVLVR